MSKRRTGKYLLFTGLTLLTVAGVLALLWHHKTTLFGIDIFFVPSNSMTPTLLPGQFILVDTHRYQTKPPQMGDVVVFKHPSENNPTWLVKRLAPWPQGVYCDPEKPWYVLGDNALHSHDSRYFGGVKIVYAPVTHVLFRWNGESIECPGRYTLCYTENCILSAYMRPIMLSATVFTGRRARLSVACCWILGAARTLALIVAVNSTVSHADGLTRWPLLSPGTLNWTGHVRARMESLDDQYRAGGEGSDQVMAFRTNLRLSIPLTHFRDSSEVVLEAMDSRQAQADDNTSLNTGTVNTLEAVQAKVSIRSDLLPWQLGKHGLDFGRQTLDLGSRRLIARNRYRNTLNTFDGLNLTTRLRYSDTALQAFLLYPVSRYPDLQEDLMNNQHEADKSSLQVQLFGAHADGYVLKGRVRGSVQWLRLREADTSRRDSRNRQLNTYAGRMYLPSKPGQWDFDLEMIRQSGRSRLSSDPTDTRDLKHDAWFHHMELGYQFRGYARWRVVAQYDYASGDADPDDDKNNRFDTLYGARRFDFGPTGIFGSVARSNVVSPGLRTTFKPSRFTEVMFAWRWYELASAHDAWVGSGYSDTSGRSGNEIGQQAEVRFRWDLVKSVRFETGIAWLDLDDYAENVNALSSDTGEDSDAEEDVVPDSAVYSYGQITWTF